MAKKIPLLNINESKENVNENLIMDLFTQVYQMWNDTSHYVDAAGVSDMTKGEYFRTGVYAAFGQLAWLVPAIKSMKGSGAKTAVLAALAKAGSKLKSIVGLAKAFKSAKTVDDAKAAVIAAGGDGSKFEKEAKGGKDASESLKFYESADEDAGEGTRITRSNVKKDKPVDTNESLVDLFNSVVQMWNDTSHYADSAGVSDMTKGEYFRTGVYALFGQLLWLVPVIKGMKGSGAKDGVLKTLSKFPNKIKKIVDLAKAFKSAKTVDDAKAAFVKAGGSEAELGKGEKADEGLKIYEATEINEEGDDSMKKLLGRCNIALGELMDNVEDGDDTEPVIERAKKLMKDINAELAKMAK